MNAFEKPVSKAHESGNTFPTAVLDRLKKAVGPFLLRRVKTDPDIAPDLPDKLECNQWVRMTQAQRNLYSAIVESGLRKIVPAEGSSSDRRQRQHAILALMHSLQQTCNHPATLPERSWPSVAGVSVGSQLDRKLPEFGPLAANSGKTERLLEILEEILDPPREKVLVFTQYVSTLKLLASLIGHRFQDVKVVSFHGSLDRNERDAAVTSFTDDPKCSVMILMLQCGGLGLTLTAATHVVHFDRCWNPAKEAQATDRAHRIGQRHTVVVHRLIAAETLEERLARVVATKRRLAGAALPVPVDGQHAVGEMSEKELRELFRLGSGCPASTRVQPSAC